jgi:hypothetical protein
LNFKAYFKWRVMGQKIICIPEQELL